MFTFIILQILILLNVCEMVNDETAFWAVYCRKSHKFFPRFDKFQI